MPLFVIVRFPVKLLAVKAGRRSAVPGINRYIIFVPDKISGSAIEIKPSGTTLFIPETRQDNRSSVLYAVGRCCSKRTP